MARVNLNTAKAIFGNHLIGPDQVRSFYSRLGLSAPSDLTNEIPYDKKILEEKRGSHILVLFTPISANGQKLTINRLRDSFGLDPSEGEPCFYNQDWYVNEPFANKGETSTRWHLISRDLAEPYRGILPVSEVPLPSALLLTYIFFITAFSIDEILFPNIFVWSSDTDSNGDRIYVGRYYDPKGIAKNGFSVHRHLSITKIYGMVDFI